MMSLPNPIITQEAAEEINKWATEWGESKLRAPVPPEMKRYTESLADLFTAGAVHGAVPAAGIAVFHQLVKEAGDNQRTKGWLLNEIEFEAQGIRSGDREGLMNEELTKYSDLDSETFDIVLDIYNIRKKRKLTTT